MRRHRRHTAALAAFVLLAVVHTWPLATAPGTLTRHDNADTFLNQWILAWDAHALVHQPLRLFEANIFYPQKHTLAYSEHLIVQALMGAPLTWLGASPVLAFNFVLLAGLALTGWATCLVVASWTDDWMAGALAGSVAAFNGYTMSRIAHVQAMHVEFLPLALLALDRLLRSSRLRDAAALGAWSALQMLCSGYLLVFTTVTLVTSALVRAGEWSGRGRWSRVPLLAGAGTLALAACAPFLVPYASVRAEQNLVRSLDEVAMFSATGWNYLTAVSRLHYGLWSHRVYIDGRDPFFPGVVPLLLLVVSLASGIAWRDCRARMLLATGTVCVALSLGPSFPPYLWLYRILPLVQGLRGASRFGSIAVFAVGVLAAFGLAWLRRTRILTTSPRRLRLGTILATTAVLVTNVEALTVPRDDLAPAEHVPAVYRILRDDPRAVAVEIPFWPTESVYRNGRYVFNSIGHWRPIVNGYSGFVPDAYVEQADVLGDFPDEASVRMLRTLGVTHVVVHLDEAPDVPDRLAAWPELEQVAGAPEIRIYALRDVNRRP